MIVLHVDSGREWRGGQRQVLLLARGAAAHGVTSAIVAPSDSALAARAAGAGIDVLGLRVHGDIDPLAAMRLSRIIVRVQPTIVHAHDARAHATVRLAASRARQWKLVVTRRTAFGPRRDAFTRFKYGRGVDRYIAISGAVRDGLVAAGVEPQRIRIVHSGIEPVAGVAPEDWRLRLELGHDARIVGSVGALSAEKGHADMIEALPAVADPRVHLVIVGAGFQLNSLRNQAAELGLAGRVHLPGFVDRPRDAMAGFDIYVQPSRAEGLGTSLLDALAIGLPAIATSAGGLAEVIEPEESGLLVPPGDPLQLARALRRLLGDDALADALRQGARRRAAKFAAEAMVAGTLAVYAELGAAP